LLRQARAGSEHRVSLEDVARRFLADQDIEYDDLAPSAQGYIHGLVEEALSNWQ
jgi:hypothetical protein